MKTLIGKCRHTLGILAKLNKVLAIASATGIIRKKDSRLLAENGGPVALTNDWAHCLLVLMGMPKEKPTVK